jgi:hypothetical protein
MCWFFKALHELQKTACTAPVHEKVAMLHFGPGLCGESPRKVRLAF